MIEKEIGVFLILIWGIGSIFSLCFAYWLVELIHKLKNEIIKFRRQKRKKTRREYVKNHFHEYNIIIKK